MNKFDNFAQKIIGLVPYYKFHTGNSIPQIGFGTSGIGGTRIQEVIKYVVTECGYRLIDTAIMYQNQPGIGAALQEIYKTTNIKRSDIFLISKIPPWMQGTEKAKEAIDQILKELQTDYIDLMMIHWPYVEGLEKVESKHAEIRLQTWKVMEEAKDQGKIKDLAMSNFTIEHMEHLFQHCKHKPVLNQLEIHPLYFDEKTIEFCRKHNILVQAYASLGKGRTNLLEIELIKNLAEKYKKTPAQICLRWAIQHKYLIIPKSNNEERMKSNIDIFEFEISPEDMQKIDAMNEYKKVLPDPHEVLNSFLNLGKPSTK